MFIERLQITEGFLDGLDITFRPGLNVLVGARGVGKTSVLELIRYVLRIPHVDLRRAAVATQHAESVLMGGRVTVTYNNEGQRWTASRSAADPAGPPPSVARSWPIMLGQNELEGIGLDPLSRLRLIDAQANLDSESSELKVRSLASQAQSLTTQLRDLSSQREALRQQEHVRKYVLEELEAARNSEAKFFAQAPDEVHALRLRLKSANAAINDNRRIASALETLAASLTEIRASSSANELAIDEFADELEAAALTEFPFHEMLRDIRLQQHGVSQALQGLMQSFHAASIERRSSAAEAEDGIRPLRLEFEKYEQGANEAAQLTARLTDQLAQIDGSLSRVAVLEERFAELRSRRRAVFDELDRCSEVTWSVRQKAAATLSGRFYPRIRVTIEHFGDRSAYSSALATALRGSGLQYNQVAEWLSERVSPQELVHSVESGDAAQLATLGELTSSRVEKLVAHLAGSDALGPVLTAAIEDVATFELLVGRDYKSSERLSTGQRCSVVLPLILADQERILLLDQPEDHLDNAYLVDNTIGSLVDRSRTAQTIVATHNANVPVLGDAAIVFVLESDGRRGYVREHGPLSDSKIVEAVTELMEGGRDAFARRAAFYESARAKR
jgi:hypothetical protein